MSLKIGIVTGSDSDLPVIEETKKVLTQFGVEFELNILSAHRTPKLATEYATKAASRGVQVIIAAAGMANHLAGAMAANSILPVIGVPLDGSSLKGLDSLFSTVQMPKGVPVACVSIGKAGAINAAFLALQILALKDEKIATQLVDYRKNEEKRISEKNS